MANRLSLLRNDLLNSNLTHALQCPTCYICFMVNFEVNLLHYQTSYL